MCDTTSSVAEEGMLIRVDHVGPDAGVVEATPTRSRGLSLESVQSAPPDDRQVGLERPAHNLLMVAEESKRYPAALEGLPR